MGFEENRYRDNDNEESSDYGTFFTPPFYGTGEMLCWHTQTLMDSLDKDVLYGKYWNKGDNSSGKLYQGELDEICDLLMQEIIADQLVDGRGYYGFFPVIAEDETLLLLDPADFHTEIASFRFPKVKEKAMRSYTGFFRPEGDIVSVQIVTAGFALEERYRKYDTEKRIQGQYLKGIGTYLSELLAEKVTREIRRALSLAKDQGIRRRSGAPGMPDASVLGVLLDIMCAEDRLGVTLDNRFSLKPEYSALDIFIHHGQAHLF